MATDPNQPRRPADEPPREPVREREVIVTNGDGGRRSGMGSALVAVVAIIVLAVIGIVVVNAIGGSGGESPDVNLSPDVNVSVPDGGGGNGGS